MSKPWFNKKFPRKNKTYDNKNEPSFITNLPNHGFSGFRLYFPDETNLDCTEILKHVSCFKTFFKENSSIYSIADIVNARSFTIDYKFIVDHNEILSKWINFKDDLIDNCEYSLKCIGLAMHQFIIDSYENEAQENRENVVKLVEVPMIQARISNVEPILQLKDLRVNCYGKLVTVKGTVIKAGHVKLMCQYMTFSCSICSGTQIVKQVDGTYTPPTKCQTVGCRAQSNFNAEPMSNFNRTMSWQSIKIQELLGSEQFDHARIPRMLECELLEDLVKTCIPGDDITVTGVIKVRDHLSNHGKNKQNTVFSLYLEAISVYNNKRHNKSESTEGITFNTNDYYLIKSLLEAMEQQSISIAKAAIVCTLPTRATILAAANPAGGHYNKSKTISENLRMGSPMLSRFDLIFILLDQANEQLDILLSRHILGMHMGNETSNGLNDTSSGLELSTTGRESLRERLQTNGEKLDLIPHNLFRKFIAYSQKYVKSHLSDEAKTLLKAFYLTLRKQFQTGDCTPVTTRQLNSLIRLTQARAKAELREEATKEDAEDVIEIMKFSLIDIFTDSSGILDKTRSQNGTGTSTKSQITKLLRLIQRKSDTESKALFSTNELKEMGEMVGIGKNKFFTVLQNLNIQGFLLNKGQNRYQLVTADV
ncbi:DNA helicase MCM8 isoform X3 [Leptinotarsa decemlineata]|uniref:DNA helicase MCM8 isoform X3 n=1 Tax=Leptinotarsa decemlineata TaxID=7539 RepID=UPI003D305F3C